MFLFTAQAVLAKLALTLEASERRNPGSALCSPGCSPWRWQQAATVATRARRRKGSGSARHLTSRRVRCWYRSSACMLATASALPALCRDTVVGSLRANLHPTPRPSCQDPRTRPLRSGTWHRERVRRCWKSTLHACAGSCAAPAL